MEYEHLVFTIATICAVLWVYVTLWFVGALYIQRNDIADIAWGPGIALVAITALALSDAQMARVSILTLLVVIWAVRLSLHITRRTLHKQEDYRYAAWRVAWGRWFIPRTYAQIFLFQGLLMVVVGYPAIHAGAYGDVSLGILDGVGVLLWVIGLLFETVSDAQLASFLKTNRGTERVCDVGLWNYSRHPNYFGEILMWWGIAIPLLAVPYGAMALISPLTITFLIVFVSGVPLLEKRLMERPEYRTYASRTSMIIPLPPKHILVENGAGR